MYASELLRRNSMIFCIKRRRRRQQQQREKRRRENEKFLVEGGKGERGGQLPTFASARKQNI